MSERGNEGNGWLIPETLTRGDRVRLLREAFGLSQTEFAQAIGLSRAYIGQIENDQFPLGRKRRTWINRVAQRFGIPETYFELEQMSTPITREQLKEAQELTGNLAQRLLINTILGGSGSEALLHLREASQALEIFNYLPDTQNDPLADIVGKSRIEMANVARLINTGRGELTVPAHKIYWNALYSASEGEQVQVISSFEPQWWTSEDYGLPFSQLALEKAKRGVRINAILVLNDLIDTERSTGAPQESEFIKEIIVPLCEAGITFRQIGDPVLWRGDIKNSITAGKRFAAWSEKSVVRFPEPEKLWIATDSTFINHQARYFERLWQKSKDLPSIEVLKQLAP